MSKTLNFNLGGFANIPVEDITFFDDKGSVVDVSSFDSESLTSMLLDGELTFDWLQLSEHPGFQISLDSVEVVGDEEEDEELFEEDEE